MVGVATKDAVAVDGVLNGVRPLPLQFFKAGGRRQAAGPGSGETGLDPGARDAGRGQSAARDTSHRFDGPGN